MNTEVKVLENSIVSLTVEVGQEVVTGAVNKAYNEMKKDFNMPGFRKGKVPKAMIEKMYGPEVFFNKAADIIIDETLATAVEENKIDMAARLRQGDVEVAEMSKDGMKYIAHITVRPEVELGEYKNLTVEVAKAEVSDEDVDMAINAEAEKNSREITVTDRAVQPQDKVIIDFEGFVDGEAFEGGKGEDYALVIGSKSFIDNFEDQLIGAEIGKEVEVNVTFPAEYHAENLAGKPAMFKVTVKEIKVKELPAINDDFAADVSEFETLADYKADIKAKLTTQKEASYKAEVENQAIQQAVDNAKLTVPNNMIEDQVDRSIKEFEMRMRQQGLELAQYLQFTGMDMDKFRENFRKDAEFQLRSREVLEAIVKAEEITVTEEEVMAEVEKLATRYKMEVEELKKSFGAYEREMLSSDLRVQKAADLITSTAKVEAK
ncbi:trigger factor [Niameybacter massiliensis]|uniref:Trigger factor n=1 Tax=Holtiella tumoricola TaxID=3018743 RepID=A0AA42DJL9_9FIRM|nr:MULTISPECIES: trigger factor [Lachnospirales]MDA3730207.1 trigger factor [Holtiella tumoricola]